MSWENKLNGRVSTDWLPILLPIFELPEVNNIFTELSRIKKTHVILPAQNDILNAFKYCSFENTKVVILGQD